MTSRRSVMAPWWLAVVGALLLAACSSEQHSTPLPTTTSAAATTTTVAPSTTSAVSTSTTSSTTSTSTTTSTTIPAVKGLGLSDTGLGGALFGAAADEVVAYVRGVLGAPTSDSGWVDPASTGQKCTGTQVRFVTWRDLALSFTDDSLYAKGLRHFVSFAYGPSFGATIDPYGLTTDAGVGIGDTVKALRAAYPATKMRNPDKYNPLPHFAITSGLAGTVTSVHNEGLITSFVGGAPCSK